jgi:hypothetical protein
MKKKLFVITALIISILLFSFAAYSVVANYRNLRHRGVLRFSQYRLRSLADVDLIQRWMTFNYINKVFNLPADYLKINLGIIDKRYPNIIIGKYLDEVKKAVSQK